MTTTRPTPKSYQIQELLKGLRQVDLDTLSDASRGGIVDLAKLVDQIMDATKGEIRIVANGVRGALKSTTIELLLGRAVSLQRGPHAVTAAATELRLVRGGEATVDPEPEVVMLSERGAQLRLGLAADGDARTKLSADMKGAAGTFEFGASYPLSEYLRRGGGLHVDAPGVALVDRVIRNVSVPDWDLSWARQSNVVLVDMPGARTGGYLEDVVRKEQLRRAHLSLEFVEARGALDGRPGDDDCPRIVVLTKIDEVTGLEYPSGPANIAEAIAANRARTPQVPVNVVAVCPQWAFTDEQSWMDFDRAAESGEHWRHAVLARQRWETADWTAAVPALPELRAAVDAAFGDGGFAGLRAAIEHLGGQGSRRVDLDRLNNLQTKASELARQLLATMSSEPKPGQRTAEERAHWLNDLQEDESMIVTLRDEARRIAGISVYDDDVWGDITELFDPYGRWRPKDPDKLLGALGTIALDEMAERAVEAVSQEIDTMVTPWLTSNGIDPAVDLPTLADGSKNVTTFFPELGDALIEAMARAGAEKPGPSIRELARTRHELSHLLAELIVEAVAPLVRAFQTDVVEDLRATTRAASRAQGRATSVDGLLRSIIGVLDPRADARAA